MVLGVVCDRSLRTQQCAESQCQAFILVPAPFVGGCEIPLMDLIDLPFLVVGLSGSFFLLMMLLASFGVGGVVVCFSTESLILAQDERWRRA